MTGKAAQETTFFGRRGGMGPAEASGQIKIGDFLIAINAINVEGC